MMAPSRFLQPNGIRRFLTVLAMAMLAASTSHADDLRQKANAQHTLTTPGASLDKPEASIKPGLAGSFLSGRFATHHQDLQEAARYMSDTLAHDPDNEKLQHEAMRMNLLAGNIDIATGLAQKLANSSDGDPLVACLLMLSSVKAGNYADAKTTIERAPQTGLFGLVRPVILQWITVGSGELKSVDMQAAIDKAGFFAPFLTYHGALMNDVLGNTAAAGTAYGKATSDPGVTPYRVIEVYANFDERQGQWDKAQALYDAYAKANPDSNLIPDKLVPGTAPKPLIGTARDGLAELFFTTASILFGDDSTQDTFLYLRIALELRPDIPPAQLMLANLYEQTGDYKQAIATYDAIPDGSVFYRRGQIRKALNFEALGEKDQAIALLDTIATRYPKDATALITKGDMLRESESFTDAADAYSAAIIRTEPLTKNDWPLLYARGISYERAGNWDQAEADFNRALVLSPDQPDVLNYLSYSWLTMNKNILKAREYLKRAVAARPDDAHIIDSAGWANYLAGDFKGAVNSFEKAAELMPDDVTVNDHLGDAYWRVGRQTEARYQWERALTFKPDKETADALHNKLDNGLPALTPASDTTPAATPAPSASAESTTTSSNLPTNPASIQVQ